jgi:hypothetical protein
VGENIADAFEPRAAAHRALQPSVPELVVNPTLILVTEHLIGLGDLLELGLSRSVPRVSVGVMLERLPAIRLAQLVACYLARDAQDFVVVTLGGHRGSQEPVSRRVRAKGPRRANIVGQLKLRPYRVNA